jgi:type III pantothenate kinase
MAAGIPVIATNRGGPLDILPTRLHGILVPPRDPNALANAVRELAHDDALRQAMVKQARGYVKDTYDTSKVIPRIEDFYRRVTFGSG